LSKAEVHGTIYMPSTTPKLKISKVKLFGKDNIEIVLEGDTFDEAQPKLSLGSKLY